MQVAAGLSMSADAGCKSHRIRRDMQAVAALHGARHSHGNLPAMATWPKSARTAARCETSFVENSASQVFASGNRPIKYGLPNAITTVGFPAAII